MNFVQKNWTHLLAATLLTTTVGCEQASAPTVTRAAIETVSSVDEEEGAVMSFSELNSQRPSYVDELMSLRPIRGRDRNVRFSQPMWAQAAAMPVIFHRLLDTDETSQVRAALAGALRTNRGPWEAQGLELLAVEEDPRVRAGLMMSLADTNPEYLVPAVLEGLDDADAGVRDWATHGAVRLFANHRGADVPATVRASLLSRLSDDDAIVRAAAARALSFEGTPDNFDAVAGLLVDDEPKVRLAVIDALGRLDGVAARARILNAGLDKDSDVRVARAALRL